MITPISTVPASILRTKANPVVWDRKTLDVVRALRDTLIAKDNPKGVGLAAPQINKKMRMFVTWLASDPQREPTIEDMTIFVNPQIIQKSAQLTFGPDPEDPYLEGCLSIPSIYGPVPRYEWVQVTYETLPLDNQTRLASDQPIQVSKRFTDFAARVVQHEYDHLEGVLFTDYILKLDLPVYEFRDKKMIEMDKEILKSF